MGIKRHDNGGPITCSRLRTQLADERRVAPVHAVEVPESHRPSAAVRGRHSIPINNFNRHVLDRPASSRTTQCQRCFPLMIAIEEFNGFVPARYIVAFAAGTGTILGRGTITPTTAPCRLCS